MPDGIYSSDDHTTEPIGPKAENPPGRVSQAGESVTSIAHTTADRLGRTADYVRTHDLDQMLTDVKTLVRSNPGPSLLLAAAFGFLVGRTIARD